MSLIEKKILLAHSNSGEFMSKWHERRRLAALSLGYKISILNMSELYPYTIFPKLDKLWKKKDLKLLQFYDKLGESIEGSDIFIHFNGALIHPDFLSQFKKIKIYHCADDPDASNVISKPVASSYDICAISNPVCIDLYKKWGCKNVFFWPLGSFYYATNFDEKINYKFQRRIPLVFIGSKYGVSNYRFVGKFLGLYQKKKFMNKIEESFPELVAYGSNWHRGRISDERIPELYLNSQVGLNLHNSIGPINGRLYDLAAFGVCQICDNKKNLNFVFEEGSEIIGYENTKEAIDQIRYYLAHTEEANEIGARGRERFLRDYTDHKIWNSFFKNIETINKNNYKFV